MATNVFGNPVTDDTVRLVYPNLTEITAKHRARVAMNYKNADDRAVNARRFVPNLKSAYDDGASTLCLVFNATGGDLTFNLNHPWAGAVWQSPIIQNWQWGAFLHISGCHTGRSKQAVVYRVENNSGVACDWMLAWNTTASMDFQNRVYTEIRVNGHFSTANWEYIDSFMNNHGNNASDKNHGCKSTVLIAEGSSSELQAIMTLENVN